MFDPDAWHGTVWHAYVEVYTKNDDPSTRHDRLNHSPDHIFRNPTDTAEWIADMTRRFCVKQTVHLMGGGLGETGDDGHIGRDFNEHVEILSRGDSVYYDFHHPQGRMHLWVEAVPDPDREMLESQGD